MLLFNHDGRTVNLGVEWCQRQRAGCVGLDDFRFVLREFFHGRQWDIRADVGNQGRRFLWLQFLFESFRHQGLCAALQIFEFASQQCDFFSFCGAKSQTARCFRCQNAVVDDARFCDCSKRLELGLHSPVWIEDCRHQCFCRFVGQ